MGNRIRPQWPTLAGVAGHPTERYASKSNTRSAPMASKRILTEGELVKLIDDRVRQFKGDITELERAIGALFVGRQFGWKVLLLIHDRKTIRRYEATLDVEFK